MEDLTRIVNELKENWANVRLSLDANRSAWKASSPAVSLEQLDEVVSAIVAWAGRIRAPTGFRPGFAIARALAISSIPAAVAACQGLGRAEYGQFTPFIASLTQSLTALHGMTALAGRDDARSVSADLAASLSESLALTQTAQKELASKKETLDAVFEVVENIESARSEVEASRNDVAKAVADLSATAESAKNASAAMDEREEKLLELEGRHTQLAEATEKQIEDLTAASATLNELQKQSAAQNELIAALLPKGASAGLAASFAARVRSLESTKWMWMGGFLLAIVGLIFVGQEVFGAPVPAGSTILMEFGKRLPLLGPMIWLGWFSAIQYGNVMRIQEDYAFKEATSKAFAGYRDYLATLESVELPDGNNALSLLAASTIAILAREPLRSLNRADQDVSPAQAVLNALKPGEKAEE